MIIRKSKFLLTKKKHVDNEKIFIIVNEFDHDYSFESIILHVIAILTKMNFDFFIRIFILIVNFRMKFRRKISSNIETFTKKFSNENYELKIAIENYWNRQIINAKNVLYQNFRCNFDENVFVFDVTKHVMSFFWKFVNNNTNHVIVVRIEKIDNEIHENVFSTLFKHRWKN